MYNRTHFNPKNTQEYFKNYIIKCLKLEHFEKFEIN